MDASQDNLHNNTDTHTKQIVIYIFKKSILDKGDFKYIFLTISDNVISLFF